MSGGKTVSVPPLSRVLEITHTSSERHTPDFIESNLRDFGLMGILADNVGTCIERNINRPSI